MSEINIQITSRTLLIWSLLFQTNACESFQLKQWSNVLAPWIIYVACACSYPHVLKLSFLIKYGWSTFGNLLLFLITHSRLKVSRLYLQNLRSLSEHSSEVLLILTYYQLRPWTVLLFRLLSILHSLNATHVLTYIPLQQRSTFRAFWWLKSHTFLIYF